jgi:hypothetical protein
MLSSYWGDEINFPHENDTDEYLEAWFRLYWAETGRRCEAIELDGGNDAVHWVAEMLPNGTVKRTKMVSLMHYQPE